MRFMQLEKIHVVFKIGQSYVKQKHLLLQRNLNRVGKLHLLHTPLNFLIKIPCEYTHFTDAEFFSNVTDNSMGIIMDEGGKLQTGVFWDS